MVIMVPLFGFLYNRGKVKDKKYSIFSIFPYFILGFIGMIFLRNIGDQIFTIENVNYEFWKTSIGYIKSLATVFLTMAMAAVGISINLNELKAMGYKPFVVGLIAALTVGVVSIISLETFSKIFLY